MTLMLDTSMSPWSISKKPEYFQAFQEAIRAFHSTEHKEGEDPLGHLPYQGHSWTLSPKGDVKFEVKLLYDESILTKIKL